LKSKNNYLELIIKLADVLNEILRKEVILEEIVTSSLFCLNKDASNHGNVDNLRPIAISYTFLKLIERVILDRLSSIVYGKRLVSKKQIGFMREAGTDMNLMRLRQKFSEVKLTGKQDKYLMFIDLKNTYDKVNHVKLFDKLRKSNVDEEIIYTVEKIYSNAVVRTNNMNEKINFNNGVLQGSLISSMLFNLFINDLVI
jgi:hypothetical protein